MDDKTESNKKEHLLQSHGILTEFDIISVTSLESFMDTYDKIANSSDDISELANVSKLLTKNKDEILVSLLKIQKQIMVIM